MQIPTVTRKAAATRFAQLIALLMCMSALCQITLGSSLPGEMDHTAATILDKTKAYSVSIDVVHGKATTTRHYGELDRGKGNRASDDTVFEIGSVSKVFTGSFGTAPLSDEPSASTSSTSE